MDFPEQFERAPGQGEVYHFEDLDQALFCQCRITLTNLLWVRELVVQGAEDIVRFLRQVKHLLIKARFR